MGICIMIRYMGRAFSLVELLVVIGIVSILSALLLPTIEASVRQSRLVQCVGNLQQHALAYQTYYQEFSDWMPFHANQPQAYYGLLAQRATGSYAYAATFPYLSYMANDVLLQYTGQANELWTCPDIAGVRSAYHITAGLGYAPLFPHYGVTEKFGKFTTHPNSGSGVGLPSWVQCATAYALVGDGRSFCRNKIGAVKNPAAVAVEVEQFPMNGGRYGNGTTYAEDGGVPRHGGDGIMPVAGTSLYADGHARISLEFGPLCPWNYMCFTKP